VAVRTAALLGAGADAEDVAQEAFVKAYRSLDRFREGGSFKPWLLSIVVNETRNLHRTIGRRASRERMAWNAFQPLLRPAEDDPSSGVLSGERREQLVAALQDLPLAQRQVVTCRYLLDLDENETATVLGLARGTVKSRSHRGLRRLSELLEPLAREVDRER
jgi:RNA polymerase sigma factor (sigma-70 family)